MGEGRAKELLAKRLYLELEVFCYGILRKTKREIYEASYKIELMAIMYEILLEALEETGEETAAGLLWWRGNLLEYLYRTWLKKEDNGYEELKSHIETSLRITLGRKEKTKDGERVYPAA